MSSEREKFEKWVDANYAALGFNARERMWEAWRESVARPHIPADNPSAAIGSWLAAALDDPAVCAEMKRDIQLWMDAGSPVIDYPSALGMGDGFVAERVNMGRGDERYIGTSDGSIGTTVSRDDPGEVRSTMLWLIADAMLTSREQTP